MIVGPILLGGEAVSDELFGFYSIGAIVLLFLVGIGTDLKMFVRHSFTGTMVGAGGVFVSYVTGALLGMRLLPWLTGGTDYHFFHAECIFLGVISTATSVTVAAGVLERRKRPDTPEGAAIIAGTVMDDILGIVLLAIGMGVIASGADKASAFQNFGVIALKYVGIWVGATVFGIVCSRFIGKWLKRMGGHNEIAIMALGFAMIVAGFFQDKKLAMIIGAYVMGLSLLRTDIIQVVREAMRPIQAFVAPVFFVVTGMMVDLRIFADARLMLFAAVFTAVAVAAKIAGCGASSLLCGFNARGALRVGLGMVPRGEVALIVAGIGLYNGFLPRELFGAAVLVTIATTLLPLPFITRALNSPLPGTRRPPAPAPDLRPMTYKFPNTHVTSLVLNHLRDGFKREGFYVHTLNREQGVYQVKKDSITIGIENTGRELVFEAAPGDWFLVETEMREVIVGIEETLQALRQPLDHAQILHGDIHNPQDPPGKPHRVFHPDAVVARLRGNTKEEVIMELLNALTSTSDDLVDPFFAFDEVMRREAAMPTVLENGLACPHTRSVAVRHLMFAIGVKPEGIDFGAENGEPCKFIVLVLSPEDATGPYLEFIAQFAVVFDEPGRAAILACDNDAALMAHFEGR